MELISRLGAEFFVGHSWVDEAAKGCSLFDCISTCSSARVQPYDVDSYETTYKYWMQTSGVDTYFTSQSCVRTSSLRPAAASQRRLGVDGYYRHRRRCRCLGRRLFRQVDGRRLDRCLSQGCCRYTRVGADFGVRARDAGCDGGSIRFNDGMVRNRGLGRGTEACLGVSRDLGRADSTGRNSVLFSQSEMMLSRAP